MSRTIKNCFYKNLTFEKMYSAHIRARKGKVLKSEVIKFEIDLENNIINLINKIKNGSYKLGKYHTFFVYEPKKREIKSLPYIDRVVHQWYVEEFIKPYFLPRFITTTYACIDDRGTHSAVNCAQKYLRLAKQNFGNDYWILKCDIKKFFYSIDQQILFDILKKYISDKKLLEFSKLLIFDNEEKNGIGIPIGNYTSQFFANIYLNELDKYAKYTLKQKYYLRYMDDFLFIVKTKEDAKIIKAKVEDFIHNNLKLELNHKSRYYPAHFGINFCGFRIFETHRLVRKSCKKKINKNIKNWNKLWENNKLDYNQMQMSINSWLGHVKHANSYKLTQKIFKKCKFLYTDDLYEKDILKLEKMIDYQYFNN